jgi:hypothetical protein
VLHPGGLVVYTARTTADAHYGTGTPRGDDMYEHGGFIVHFFDRALIDRLAVGFEVIDVTDFTEGDLPPARTSDHAGPTAIVLSRPQPPLADETEHRGSGRWRGRCL